MASKNYTKRNRNNKEVKFSSKDEMRPHSEAKVTLYGKYLEKYLAILGVVKFITKVNIIDIFCGSGVYANNKYGSPIVAFNTIQNTRIFLKTINHDIKPTTLIINDGNPASVETASIYLQKLNEENKCCEIIVHKLEARQIIDETINYLKKQDGSARNLIFIDPTGYKDIHKDDLQELLRLKSEVVLFLPVSFMHRFKGVAQKDFDKPAYVHLRRFIYEFFSQDHPIRSEDSMDIKTVIDSLQDALKFDTYYTSAFYLQRDKSNYYALFFITSSILGLERINDAKWQIDPVKGEGHIYTGSSAQMNLFSHLPAIVDLHKMRQLEDILKRFIEQNECTNRNLYHHILVNGFKIAQANPILKQWHKESTLQIYDVTTNKINKSNATYLDHKYFKESTSKVTFKLL